MTIKAKSDSCDAEFIINDEANIHEYMDVIFHALILEEFTRNTIISGLKEKLRELDEIGNGQE